VPLQLATIIAAVEAIPTDPKLHKNERLLSPRPEM
jgi:hypothetical protein